MTDETCGAGVNRLPLGAGKSGKDSHDPLAGSRTCTGTTDIPWQAFALCREVDSEIFFPEKGGSDRDAKTICALCDVTAECLEYALVNRFRHGVFGGKSERQRRVMLKDRDTPRLAS